MEIYENVLKVSNTKKQRQSSYKESKGKPESNMLCANINYANTPMQYTAIFHSCKNLNFQIKKCYLFLIFAQKMDRGYKLEPPQF